MSLEIEPRMIETAPENARQFWERADDEEKRQARYLEDDEEPWVDTKPPVRCPCCHGYGVLPAPRRNQVPACVAFVCAGSECSKKKEGSALLTPRSDAATTISSSSSNSDDEPLREALEMSRLIAAKEIAARSLAESRLESSQVDWKAQVEKLKAKLKKEREENAKMYDELRQESKALMSEIQRLTQC